MDGRNCKIELISLPLPAEAADVRLPIAVSLSELSAPGFRPAEGGGGGEGRWEGRTLGAVEDVSMYPLVVSEVIQAVLELCAAVWGEEVIHLHNTVQNSTVQYSTVQCSTEQYSTVQYSTVQYCKPE